jgi:hypothetical protein
MYPVGIEGAVLVEIDTTVGKLSEGSLLLDLSGLLRILHGEVVSIGSQLEGIVTAGIDDLRIHHQPCLRMYRLDFAFRC